MWNEVVKGRPAALLVVCHFPDGALSILPRILSRSGPLPAAHARDGEPVRRGQVYVAPPGYHLLVRLQSAVVVPHHPGPGPGLLLGPGPADLDSWGDSEEVLEAYEDLGFDVVERVQGWELVL